MAPHRAPMPAAVEARRRLAAALKEADPAGAVPTRFGEDGAAVPIPAEAARLLLDILDRMARGQTVTLGGDEEAPSPRRAALDEMTAIDQDLGLQ